MNDFFYWLGTAYPNQFYVGGLKIAGVLCSYADICVAALLVRMMDVIRRRRPSRFRYGVLAVFAILTPMLLFTEEGLAFFIAQFVILFPPYLILLYTAFTEAKFFKAYMMNRIGDLSRELVKRGEQGR